MKDALHGHPSWEFDRRFIGSISKRAVGTLTSQWPDMFSISQAKEVIVKVPEKVNYKEKERKRNLLLLRNGEKPTYVKTLQVTIGHMAGDARDDGNVEREKVLIELLKMIDKDVKDGL